MGLMSRSVRRMFCRCSCAGWLCELLQCKWAIMKDLLSDIRREDFPEAARKLMNHYCVLKKDSRYDSDLIFRFAEIELTSFFIIPCVIFIYYIIFAV